MLGSACEPVQPMATDTMLRETTSPTTILETTMPNTMTMRIRLAITCDRTDMFLVSGATWLSHELISADEEATTAEIRDDQLVLDQPISRAQAGESAEMVVEITLSVV